MSFQTALTPEANRIVTKMLADGWWISLVGSPIEWSFTKLCQTKEHGEFWRYGQHTSIERAAEVALADEAGLVLIHGTKKKAGRP